MLVGTVGTESLWGTSFLGPGNRQEKDGQHNTAQGVESIRTHLGVRASCWGVTMPVSGSSGGSNGKYTQGLATDLKYTVAILSGFLEPK